MFSFLGHSFGTEIGDDRPPQFGGDLRPDAEPALEAGHRLVQQHAEPVDSAEARGAGGREQRGFEGNVDDIRDDGRYLLTTADVLTLAPVSDAEFADNLQSLARIRGSTPGL